MDFYGHNSEHMAYRVLSSLAVIFPVYPGPSAATAVIGRQLTRLVFACPCKIEHDKPMRGGAVSVVNTFRIQGKQSVDLRI